MFKIPRDVTCHVTNFKSKISVNITVKILQSKKKLFRAFRSTTVKFEYPICWKFLISEMRTKKFNGTTLSCPTQLPFSLFSPSVPNYGITQYCLSRRIFLIKIVILDKNYSNFTSKFTFF